jgi:1-acyl-sn-glycerol-3-phosphate acyltransferase
MIYLRSVIFALALVIFTPPYALIATLSFPFRPITRYRVITGWAHIMMWVLQHIVGIEYQVEGRQNIPNVPSIALCKHQSAWETLALQQILPPQAYVLKKELLWVPFFGWGLSQFPIISIDRAAGQSALSQVIEQGRTLLASGIWVVVFPEGTRTAPGTKRRYKMGGACLAAAAGVPVVPIAHNAGEFWRRNAFLKYPGTVTVSIGPAFDAAGMSPDEINAKAEAWIEAEMHRISPERNAPA